MIIDCHGHYTTAHDDLKAWRQEQIDAKGERSKMRAPDGPAITDDQIREGLEAHQLRLQRERGTDLTIFSPRAGGMGHHIGSERSEEHTSELQSLMSISYAVFCLKKQNRVSTQHR